MLQVLLQWDKGLKKNPKPKPKPKPNPGAMVHACSPNIQEAKGGLSYV